MSSFKRAWMRSFKRVRTWIDIVIGAAAIAVFASSPAFASIPFNQPVNGTSTYYNNIGNGACGTPIDASTQMLVAVPASYWTTANPNLDPLCTNVSVQVTYNGTTITVPVEDKCPSCDSSHIDLSQPAFQSLGVDPTVVGVINVTWQFVNTSTSARTGPVTGYAGLCLDDRSASTANFNPVQVYTCNGTNAQQWTVGSDDTLRVLGKCLDVNGGGTTNGTAVDLYDCNGTGAQVWQPQSNGSLLNPQSGKCLDDTNWSTTPGTQSQIWSCTGNANQKWNLPN